MQYSICEPSICDLAVPEVLHLSRRLQKRFQLPLRSHAAIFEHDDVVRLLEHGAPVRDDQAGIFMPRKEPFPERLLGFHIERTGKIVESARSAVASR